MLLQNCSYFDLTIYALCHAAKGHYHFISKLNKWNVKVALLSSRGMSSKKERLQEIYHILRDDNRM